MPMFKKNKLMTKNGITRLYYQLLLVFTILLIVFLVGDIVFQTCWIFNMKQEADGIVYIEDSGIVKYLRLHYRMVVVCLLVHFWGLDEFLNYVMSFFRKKIHCNSLKIWYIILVLFYLFMMYADSILLKDIQFGFNDNPLQIDCHELKQYEFLYIVFDVSVVFYFVFSIRFLRHKIKNRDISEA